MANMTTDLQYCIMEMLNETVFDSDSCSSSDEDVYLNIKKPRQNIIKIKCYIENTVHFYGDKTFQEHFRIGRAIVYPLIDRFKASEYSTQYASGRENISPEKSFLLTLWYLSNKETFRQISDRFDVSLSSAHRCLLRVVKFILSIRYEYIKWPNAQQAKIISNNFKSKQGIEGILGAIDGCHVKINRPQKDDETYVNRKGYHSLLIQAVANTKRMFMDVSCGQPGSLHDARLLRKSAIFVKAEDPLFFGNMFLIGDSAYPSLDWLVPPFKDNGAMSAEHKQFNFLHSSSRIVIGHAYGLLKGRFRRLQHFENINISYIVNCIMASCVLHNICLLHHDDTAIVLPDLSDDFQSDSCLISSQLTKQESRREQVFIQLFEKR